MRLPNYHGEQQTLESSRHFQEKLALFETDPSDERLKVIYSNNETTAVAGLKIGSRWKLLAEYSMYEPTGGSFNEETESAPFATSGNMWTVDPDTGLVGLDNFYYEEGSFMGLIYILGGPDARAVDWLVGEYKRIDGDAQSLERQNNEVGIVHPYSGLSYILEEAGLVTVPVITIEKRTAIVFG